MDGAAFAAGEAIDLAASVSLAPGASVERVDFLVYGSRFGTATAPPWELTLEDGLREGLHLLRARSVDDAGGVAYSDPVAVRVGQPRDEVLFVVGNRNVIHDGDATVRDRLQAMGYDVEVVGSELFFDDPAAAEAAIAGKRFVVLAEAARPNKIQDFFLIRQVPVVCWSYGMFSELGMTGSGPANRGERPRIDRLTIQSPFEILAAGLEGTIAASSRQTAFVWGRPSDQATVVATFEGQPQRAALFTYETGAEMVAGTAPARRVGLFLSQRNPQLLTAEGWMLAEVAFAWAAGFEPLPEELPIEVEILEPADGAVLASGEAVPVRIDARPAAALDRVELRLNGGLATTFSEPPFEVDLEGLGDGFYELRARAVGGERRVGSVPVSITLGTPARGAVLVIGGTAPDADDLLLADRLTALGFEPVVVAAADFETDAAAAAPLVVLSPTVDEGDLTGSVIADLAALEVPLLTLEGALYDDLGMVEPGELGVAAAATSVVIDPNLGLFGGSPLAAGLDGEVEVFAAPRSTRWGRPGPDAVAVAGTAENGRNLAIFGYSEGDVLPGGPTPARRVGFFVAEGPLDLTAEGWRLFDAAVLWSAGFDAANQPPSVELTAPASDASVFSGAPVPFAATVADPDGTVERVLFLANGRPVGQAEGEPFEFTWTGAPDGLYRLSARAVDDDGADAFSSPRSLRVGTPPSEALLVVGDPVAPGVADQAVLARLASFGLEVEVVDAAGLDVGALVGTALVAVSASVDAAAVDPALAGAAVPVATWNGALYPLLGLTAEEDEGGFYELPDQVELLPEPAPFTPPGLTSPFAFTETAAELVFGVPGNGARIAAGLGSPASSAVFGYQAGDGMVSGTAPARRLALPLGMEGATRLTPSGERLVDAALAWVLGHTPQSLDVQPPTVEVLSPRPVTYLDPVLSDDLYRAEVVYADVETGIDTTSLQVSLRRSDGSTPFDLTPLCRVEPTGAHCPMSLLSVGEYVLEVSVSDLAGNTGEVATSFAVGSSSDQAPPALELTHPAAGVTYVSAPEVLFEGTASDDEELAAVYVGGQVARQGAGPFSYPYELPLAGGPFEVAVIAQDFAGRSSEQVVILFFDPTPPVIELTEPTDRSELLLVTDTSIVVAGRVVDDHLDVATVAGDPVTVDDEGFFETTVALDPGPNVLEVVARDLAGNEAATSFSVLRSDPAEVSITAPVAGTLVSGAQVAVTGTVDRPVDQVLVNGIAAEVEGLEFSVPNVELAEGGNLLTAVAYDAVGVATSASVEVHRDTEAPVLAITHPSPGARLTGSSTTVTGVVRDHGNAALPPPTVTVAGVPAEVAGASFSATVPLVAGPQTLPVVATDAAGNAATAGVEVEGRAHQGVAAIREVSGGGQTAGVGTALADPLVVELVTVDGEPVEGQRVIFEVTSSNGRLEGGALGDDRGRVVTTDAAGRAAVGWTLGTRAGYHDRVRATAVGFAGEVVFAARAVTGPPTELAIDFGNYQTGVVERPLPLPLRVSVTDAFRNPVAGAEVRYTVNDGGGRVNGEGEVTVTTGADGRAGVTLTLGPVEDREGNIVLAELVGGAGAPAVFLATGLVPGEALATSIRGIVLDNADRPVPGVTLRVDHSSATATTDAEGRFFLDSVPVGHVHLIADGSTATRPGDWPTLGFEMVTVSGRINAMDRPIYLLPLRIDEGIQVGPDTGGTLTLPDVPGFALTVEPGSATFGDGSQSGVVSVAVVHADKVPMAPNYGQQPRLVLTIQPPHVHFDPPARITLPNVDGLPPGAIGDIYSFRHDLGEFVAIGPAQVSEDGSVVVSGDGVGITAGGWHYSPPKPEPRPKGDGCGGCPTCRSRCISGACGIGPNDLGKPCSDGLFCTRDDSCRSKGPALGGSDCRGDKVPDVVVDTVEFQGDAIANMAEAMNRLVTGIGRVAPCKLEKFEPTVSGSYNAVKTCCEDIDGFRIKAEGSGNAGMASSIKGCMIPGASLSLGQGVKVGAHVNLDFQLNAQGSAAGEVCVNEPPCPFGLKFSGQAGVTGEVGVIVQVVDATALSAEGTARVDAALGLMFDCQGVDLEGTFGPLALVVRVTLLDAVSFSRFWEIPYTRITF